ncbi:uncharacterized protein LOC142642339 [Castanea sativa]|uniref:uncharacterized protein LOC142642339 n=1 Tax=Castanea sativa TaxID=21020 RepID=UPI003F64A180
MEMEVVLPVPPVDFNFDSNCSSPYITAPSSPQRFGNFFFSAPTSPSRASTFYQDLQSLHDMPRNSASSVIPFNWEEKPGIPKSNNSNNDDDDDEDEDFAFDFSGQLERPSLSADELFDGGKIKPLKPPPRLQVGTNDSGSNVSSPRSPRSPRSRISQGKRMVQEALSPRHKKDFDPFAAALEETRKEGQEQHEQKRGRERKSKGSSSSFSSSTSFLRKGTRSLSPLRVSDIVSEGEENSQPKVISSTTSNSKPSTSPYSSFLSSISFTKGYRKWRLKDFLLFRSASEGRATGKDPLTKYAALSKNKVAEDVKNSSFRSTDSTGSSVSSSRRRGPVSAHELHYTMNRAVSEEMRKKTFLPYKQGLLGCLGFNPGLHEVSRGLGGL